MEATLGRVKALAKFGEKDSSHIKSDLLLRLFESQWFNEWMCLQYLFQNPQNPGVEDYLCNKLLSMSEASVERYLLQFVYLAVSRPNSALERTIVALCSKSFSIALKVHWLLLSLAQDNVKNKHVDNLKDRCEKASLEGLWDVPFRSTKLEPITMPEGTLSPGTSGLLAMSPVLSPITQAPINLVMASSPDLRQNMLATPGILHKIEESQELPHGTFAAAMSMSRQATGPGLPETSENANGNQAHTIDSNSLLPSHHLAINPGRRLNKRASARISSGGGAAAQTGSSPFQQADTLQQHIKEIRDQLGEGEGVTALLHRSVVGGAVAVVEDDAVLSDDDVAGGLPGGMPLSPTTRIRHETYGATLDFMETLCEASSSLVSISQEERVRALRHTLEAINRELEKAVRRGLAVWYPLGSRNERVLRITAKEAVLLNSREKAPFMLFVEVLVTDDEDEEVTSPEPVQPASPKAAPAPMLLSHLGNGLEKALKGGSDIKNPMSVLPPTVAATGDDYIATSGISPQSTSRFPSGTSNQGTGTGTTTLVEGSGHASRASLTASEAPCEPETVSVAGTDSPSRRHTDHTARPAPHIATSELVDILSGAFSNPAAAAAVVTPRTAAVLLPEPEFEQSIVHSVSGPITAAFEAMTTAFRSKISAAAASLSGQVEQPAQETDDVTPQVSSGLIIPPLSPSNTPGSVMVHHHDSNQLLTSVSVASTSSQTMVIPHRRRQTSDDAGPGLDVPDNHQPPLQRHSVSHLANHPSDSVLPSSWPQRHGLLSKILNAADIAASNPSAGTQQNGPQQQVNTQPSTASFPQVPAGSPEELSFWQSALNSVQKVLQTAAPSASSAATAAGNQPSNTTMKGPNMASNPAVSSAQPKHLDATMQQPGRLTQEDVDELISCGALPQLATRQKASGPVGTISCKMGEALASLRGDAPLVRVKLRVLPAAEEVERQALSSSKHTSHDSLSKWVANSGPPSKSGYRSDSSTHSERKSSNGGAPPPSLMGSDAESAAQQARDLLTSGSEKALKLLSKIGICARPSFEGMDEQELFDGVVPVTEERTSGTQRLNGLAENGPKLVAMSLEVAGGVNLAIVSPYRKSRRTPSHEAISMVATQLKIYTMPPPLELGPPLPDETVLEASSWQDKNNNEEPAQVDKTSANHNITASRTQHSGPGAADAGLSMVDSIRGWGGDQQISHNADWLDHSKHIDEPNVATSTLSFSSAHSTRAAAHRSSPGFLDTSSSSTSAFQAVSAQTLSFLPISGSITDGNLSPTLLPAHEKVGGLPMVGSVVSAAAAAQPGVLSPAPSGTPFQGSSPPTSTMNVDAPQTPGIISLAANTLVDGWPTSADKSSIQDSTAGVIGEDSQQGGVSNAIQQSSQRQVQKNYLIEEVLHPSSRSAPMIIPTSNDSLMRDQDSNRDGQPEQQGTQPKPKPIIANGHTIPQPAEVVATEAAAIENAGKPPLDKLQVAPNGQERRSLSGLFSPNGSSTANSKEKDSQNPSAAASTWATVTSKAKALVAALPKLDIDVRSDSTPITKLKALQAPGSSQSLSLGPASSSDVLQSGPVTHALGNSSGGSSVTSNLNVRNSLSSSGLGLPPVTNSKLDAVTEKRRKEAWAVYGERWQAKCKRIQKESPHGQRQGWALRCVIVKSGDDCRQEQLAMQLIRTFADIFQEAALPLWVRPYEVLPTSNKTALIEVVPDALSIHTVKHRSPAGASLSDHFFAKWPRGTPECVAAQRKFTESLAAYSIICYLLQIKDRHNGNILIDDEGHLVHIDFGFMLSNSPGGVNFEAAPFKLTRELLEVMDSNSEGKPSELFDYFKVLMIQGFLACRKHHERLLLLVRMMSKSGLPCFKTGDRAVKALEKRLSLQLTEVQVMQQVLSLISDSLDAWRTRQYDYYQRLLNGIL